VSNGARILHRKKQFRRASLGSLQKKQETAVVRSIFSSSFGRWQQRCVLMLCSNLWCWSLYRVHCSSVQALYRLSLFPSEQLRTAKSHQISLFILCVCLRRRYASCVDIYRLLTPIIIFHSSGRCIQMYTVSQKNKTLFILTPNLLVKYMPILNILSPN